MCLFLLFVLHSVVVFTGGTVIQRENSRDPPFNITGDELSSKNFKFPDHELYVVYYVPTEVQIALVTDLPHLTNIFIDEVGQKRIPKFKNLPKLYEISLEDNKVEIVRKDAFSSAPVRDINLGANAISKIEEGAFGKDVRRIYLTCNELTKIDSKWFANPAVLEELDVGGNKIEVIEKGFFKKFTALHRIVLSYNHLKVIGDGTFSNRNSFYVLRLDHNSLTELKPTIFQEGNITIDFLDISHNNISFLYRTFRDKIHLTMRPRVGGNPWQCPCYQQIKQWRPPKSVEFYPRDPPSKPKCIVSEKSDNCIELVEQDVLETYAKTKSAPTFSRDEVCACLAKVTDDTYEHISKCYGV